MVGLFTNFSVDVDEDKLWTPEGSRALEHQKWIEDVSGFPKPTQNLVLFFHSDGKSVLGQKEVSRVFEVYDAVVATANYDTMCADSKFINSDGEVTCEVDGIVNFWSQDSPTFESEVASDEEAISAMSQPAFPDGTRVSESGIFGYPERNEDGTLTSALSYSVVFKLPPTDTADDFEDDVLDILLDMRDAWNAEDGNTFKVEVQGYGSFGDEFERAILEDIPLIPIVFIIMSIFTALVFFKRDKVRSRSLLGFGAVVGVLLSLLSGFGLLFIIGTPFTSMTQLLPFVIFGIGLDDAFIMFGSYSRTDESKEIPERIRDTIDEVGISITSTTVTSTLAFGLGCLSSIPAVYWLCFYAFPTIAIIYFYTLTFFVAWIVLDERRIQSNRRDCCFCITAKDVNPQDGENPSPQINRVDDFMVRYADFLMKPVVKIVVILAFTGLAIACGFSTSNLKQAFSFTDVMPKDSYVTSFFDAMEAYTVRNSVAPFAYFRGVNQADEDMQQQMEDYVMDIVALDAVEEEPENFWLVDFKAYVADQDLSGLSFNQQLDAFLGETIYFDLYNGNIVRDENGDITESRVRINFDNVDEEDVTQSIDTLEDQRKVSKSQPVNAGFKDWNFFSYDQIYNIWEFFAVSVDELIFTTIIGVVAVTGVALVFIPHWTASLFVLPFICVLYVDLLGVMSWAGVDVNAVSYISLVLVSLHQKYRMAMSRMKADLLTLYCFFRHSPSDCLWISSCISF